MNARITVTALALGACVVASAWAQDDATAQPTPEQKPAAVETIPVPAEEEKEDRQDEKADANATHLESIQVTSEKRVKAQRDIPGSVGAIRGEELERMKAQGMSDYLKIVPGVFFADQGDESSVPVIRGIASQLSNGFTAQTTGIFLDEMPFADLFAPQSFPDLNPFDLERVEVLKGPQGTLFGAGALAGAVRYITHKPDFSVWETKLSQTFLRIDGNEGISPTAAAAVNVPLFGDKVAIRGVVLRHNDPGRYRMGATDNSGNILRDDPGANRSKQSTERMLAAWNPLDELKVSGFYFSQRSHADDIATADNPDTPSRGDMPFASPSDHRFSGGNLLASYDLGWATLTSSTNGMRKYNYVPDHEERGFNSLKHQNQNMFLNVVGGHVNGYTQELRLSSPEGGNASNWEWLGGAAFIRYNDSIWQYENAGPYMPAPASPDDISETQRETAVLYADIKADAREKAVFGEVTRKFAEERWELTGAGRYYETEAITDTLIQGAEINALFPGQTGSRVQFDQLAKGFNPKVSLRYLHNRNVQWYALAAKGFQFGGIQLNPPAAVFVTGAQQAGFNFGPYDSSKLWNYESGIRTEWLDRRLRFDLAVFYLDWSKLQETIRVTTAGGVTFGLIVNIGRAHSEGIESALEVLPFPGAKWTLAAGWTKAITDVSIPTSAGTVPGGSRLPGAPRFQASNVISYEHSLPYFTSWQLGPVLTHSHIGTSPDNIIPTGEVGGYDTLDARLSLSKPSSPYVPELSLGVNNITNVNGVSFHGRTDIADSATGETFDDFHFIQPRTTMLSLTMNF